MTRSTSRLLTFVACLVAAAALAAQQTAPPPDQPAFQEWLTALREEAVSRGISPAIVDAALASVEAPQPVVVARDRAQPERTRSLDDYVAGWVSTRSVTTARDMQRRHRQTLDRVSARYGVPAPVLVSVWGIESNFGRFTGSYPTVSALATLAYDGRRQLFRDEIFHALTILDQGHISLDQMKGSWAGAMGQPQFMPSSYLKHAVDFDGDGRADIWTNQADVFASIANYLVNAGWTEGERWGREVRVSREALDRINRDVPMRQRGCQAIQQMTAARPLDEWGRLGVRLAGGGALPQADMAASLVRGERRYFLVYRNYLALLDYNCSNSYAVSVGLLADRVW
jgi:membrane-bound lytic murein transglycosylase B